MRNVCFTFESGNEILTIDVLDEDDGSRHSETNSEVKNSEGKCDADKFNPRDT